MTPEQDTKTAIEHPLEAVFDIDPGTTNLMVSASVSAPMVPDVVESPAAPTYDAKDESIEQELTNIHNESMALVAEMKTTMSYMEPKGVSRAGEVAIQALNTALDAIKQKADIKKHKDKLKTVTGGNIETVNNTVNNNLVIDRGALLDRIVAGDL